MNLKRYRKFKKKHKTAHIILVAIALVMLWRGIWGLLDIFLVPNNALLSYVLSILIAFIILYFDDFHLKELE